MRIIRAPLNWHADGKLYALEVRVLSGLAFPEAAVSNTASGATPNDC